MEGAPRRPRFGPQSHWVAGTPGPREGRGPDLGVEASHREGNRRRDLVQRRARQELSGGRGRVNKKSGTFTGTPPSPPPARDEPHPPPGGVRPGDRGR